MPGTVPLLGVHDVVRARLFSTCGGQTAVTTIHYQITSTIGTPNYFDFASAFDNQVGSVLANSWLAADTQYVGCTAQQVGADGRALTIQFPNQGNAGAGGQAAPTSPKQAACIISFRSYFPRPKYRGRIYVPFIPRSYITTNGELSAPGLIQLNLLVAAIGIQMIVPGPTGFTADVIIFHGNPPDDPTPVDYVLAGNSIATQIRRSDYRALNRNPF